MELFNQWNRQDPVSSALQGRSVNRSAKLYRKYVQNGETVTVIAFMVK